MSRWPQIVLVLGAGTVAACVDGTAPYDTPAGAGHYLTTVLDLMQANSLHRLTIDWTSFRAKVFQAAQGTQSISELAPAIRLALAQLEDGHSSFRRASGDVLYVPTRTCTTSFLNASTPKVPANIGYVRVGAFSGGLAASRDFATGIQNAIRAADSDSLVGWIVDLRANGGGNMWPMVAGLGPIIGDDTIGKFIDPVGVTSVWEYRDGAARLNGAAILQLETPYTLKSPRPKVAVLMDNGVASSGEATAIAFRGRPNARTFGFKTCGLSTANSPFRMVDGAVLNLTVSTMADRTGRTYGDQLVPDEITQNNADTMQRAIAWILSRS